jgi:hypothetical protein
MWLMALAALGLGTTAGGVLSLARADCQTPVHELTLELEELESLDASDEAELPSERERVSEASLVGDFTASYGEEVIEWRIGGEPTVRAVRLVAAGGQ